MKDYTLNLGYFICGRISSPVFISVCASIVSYFLISTERLVIAEALRHSFEEGVNSGVFICFLAELRN